MIDIWHSGGDICLEVSNIVDAMLCQVRGSTHLEGK
jgi:hypothetical protein